MKMKMFYPIIEEESNKEERKKEINEGGRPNNI